MQAQRKLTESVRIPRGLKDASHDEETEEERCSQPEEMELLLA